MADIELTLTKTRMLAGVWEGVLTGHSGDASPVLAVSHNDTELRGISVTDLADQPGAWVVRVAVSPEHLTDGVQTFVISEAESGARLAAFSIVTGEPLEDDIRAEVDLLRAELDMLKRAFRRHCLETM